MRTPKGKKLFGVRVGLEPTGDWYDNKVDAKRDRNARVAEGKDAHVMRGPDHYLGQSQPEECDGMESAD
jgi:hypothetical protein